MIAGSKIQYIYTIYVYDFISLQDIIENKNIPIPRFVYSCGIQLRQAMKQAEKVHLKKAEKDPTPTAGNSCHLGCNYDSYDDIC